MNQVKELSKCERITGKVLRTGMGTLVRYNGNLYVSFEAFADAVYNCKIEFANGDSAFAFGTWAVVSNAQISSMFDLFGITDLADDSAVQR